MAAGKLEPLGDPAPSAPKWFFALQVIRLAVNKDWLHKVTYPGGFQVLAEQARASQTPQNAPQLVEV